MEPLYALVPVAFFAATAAIVVVVVRSRAATRRLLIEHGMLNEGYVAVIAAEARAARWTALRWGLVLAGIGSAMLLSGTLGLDSEGPMPWGLAALGAALGYVAYFFASARLSLGSVAALALATLVLSGPAAAQPVDAAMASTQWYDRTDDGHRQYVYELGHAAAAGDTVVVLHGGWGAEHGYLLDAVRPLGDAYRLVLYDQRGSLRSPAPDSTVSLDRLVADLDGLREDLGLRQVTLLAHSMGNALAYAYLAAHPGRVRGLVLVGAVLPAAFSQAGPDTAFVREVWPAADAAVIAAAHAALFASVAERAKAHLDAAGLLPEPLRGVQAMALLQQTLPLRSDRERSDAWRILFTAVNTCDGSNWSAMQGGQVFYSGDVAEAVLSDPGYEARQAAFWPALQAFRGPVRVVMGTCDYVDAGPAVWPHVVPRLHDAALTVVDGAGHSLWMDQPDGFVAAARAALADATP